MNCLYCNKPFEGESRESRKFCNTSCRVGFNRKKTGKGSPSKPAKVPLTEGNAMQKDHAEPSTTTPILLNATLHGILKNEIPEITYPDLRNENKALRKMVLELIGHSMIYMKDLHGSSDSRKALYEYLIWANKDFTGIDQDVLYKTIGLRFDFEKEEATHVIDDTCKAEDFAGNRKPVLSKADQYTPEESSLSDIPD